MRERIRKLLRWFDARLIGDDETFPIYRSDDGSVVLANGGGPRRMQVIVADFIQAGPSVHVATRERFRVEAFKASPDDGCCADCGQATHWLDLQFRSPRDEEWRPLLMLPEMKLSVVLEALQDMARFLEREASRGTEETSTPRRDGGVA